MPSSLSRSLAAILSLVSLALVSACNEDQVTFTADTSMQLQLVAGGLGGRGYVDGGPGVARLEWPRRVAIDIQSGVTYVQDDCTFRRIGTDGRMATLGQNDPQACATQSGFTLRQMVARPGGGFFYTSSLAPQIIAVDDAGVQTVYYDYAGSSDELGGLAIAADGSLVVQRTDLTNSSCGIDRIALVAGVPTASVFVTGGCGDADGAPGTGQLEGMYLSRLRFDSAGNLFMATSSEDGSLGGMVRKIAPDGTITTMATGVGEQLYGLAIDAQDQLYVLSWGAVANGSVGNGGYGNSQVWKIVGGAGQLVAGQDVLDPPRDGTGADARITQAADLAIDAAGDLWVADETAGSLRKITSAGIVSTPYGSLPQAGYADGNGGAARFNDIYGLATDAAGNTYVSDSGNCVIRKIDLRGNVTTVAGIAGSCTGVDGAAGTATLADPVHLVVDAAGTLFFADGCAIRKVSTSGAISTLAGAVSTCLDVDGTGTDARLAWVYGLAIDSSGNLYSTEGSASYTADAMAACGNQQCPLGSVVRKITPAGVVTTLAGTPGTSGYADGQGAAAEFGMPYGVAVDAQGNVYVADLTNHAVRKITPGGLVSTLAGSATQAGSADGTGAAARFVAPGLLALAQDGSLVVFDVGTYTEQWDGTGATGAGTVVPPQLRALTTAGVATTLLSSADYPSFSVVLGTTPRLNMDVYSMTVDSTGGVLLSTENSVVRYGVPQ